MYEMQHARRVPHVFRRDTTPQGFQPVRWESDHDGKCVGLQGAVLESALSVRGLERANQNGNGTL